MKKILMNLIIVIIVFGCQQQEYYQYLQKPVEENAFDNYQTALDYFGKSELDSSLLQINEAIKIKSGYAPFYYLKGKIFLINGNKDSAMVNFETALKFKSFYPEIWQDISSIYFNEKKYEKALYYYEKLAGYLPQKEQYIFYSARCKNKLGQFEVAAAQLEELITNGFYFDKLYYELAYSYWRQNNIERSVINYNKYLKTHSEQSNKEELLVGIQIFLANSEIEEVLSLANLGLKLIPGEPAWHYYRMYYYQQKNNTGALNHERLKLKDLSFKNDSGKYYSALWNFKNDNFQQGFDAVKSMDNFASSDPEELYQLFKAVNDMESQKQLLKYLQHQSSPIQYEYILNKIESGE